jgi:hypothetical protein
MSTRTQYSLEPIQERPRRHSWRRVIVGVILVLLAIGISACVSSLAQPAPTSTPMPVASNDQPGITISPERGYAGIYVQVTGQGWPVNSLVIVSLVDDKGRSGILAASTADEAGTINSGFLYPISQRWLSDGAHQVLAYTADGNLQAMADFTVVPPGTELTPTVTGGPETPTATFTPSPTLVAATVTASPTRCPAQLK